MQEQNRLAPERGVVRAHLRGADMAWLFKGSSGGAGLSLHDVKEPVFKKEPADSGLASASFSLFAGARRADGEGVSVFRLERSKGDEGSTKVQSALKCVKLAKTLTEKAPDPHVVLFAGLTAQVVEYLHAKMLW